MSTKIIVGNSLKVLADLESESVHCVITSPPYWGLRSYQGDPGMIGLEDTFEEHLSSLVAVFREVRRVLRHDGTLWLNYGDAYAGGGRGPGSGKQTTNTGSNLPPFHPAGYKAKDLMMMPARVALALQADGWWLRQQLPWIKRNPMPESVTDRPTSATEFVYLLAKSPRVYYDAEAVRVPSIREGRKMPDGWDTGRGAHGSIHRKGREKGKRTDKQRGHSRRHAVFNDRWNAMEKDEQQATGRSFRNTDLMFQSITAPFGLISAEDGTPLAIDVPPRGFKEAHFATFPPQLVEPFIKAGTSERGCCAECGAPWVRVVNVSYVKNRPSAGDDPRSRSEDRQAQGSMGGHNGWQGNNLLRNVTESGWRPTCNCYDALYRDLKSYPKPRRGRKRVQRDAWPGWWKRVKARPGGESWTTVPAVVLDPFAGAGTVGLVAQRLQRDAILIELSPQYVEMMKRRLVNDAPLFASENSMSV